MPLLLPVVLAAPHLEDAHLVMTTLRQHRDRNRGPRHQRRAHDDALAAAHRQNLVEGDFGSDVRRHLFYLDLVAGSNLVLLATGFYDRVHGNLDEDE